MSRAEFDEFVALADSNHVVVRALEVILLLLRDTQNAPLREWAEAALAAERARITTAVTFLAEICRALKDHGLKVAVIKSLDHWPDLGSDLDLYTSENPRAVCKFMQTHFHARMAPRSWGDRLAAKWNFFIPGLPEAVEIHMGRLGQTGEQVAIASSLLERTRTVTACGRNFSVPSASDRIMLSTLQRMYRHFYFRLCDIVDTTTLADRGEIDYANLRTLASVAGIWEGAATYLVIVSDYLQMHRGTGLNLPKFVLDAARFGGDHIYYEKRFLRVPIMPQSARLYGTQLAGVLGKGEWHNGARLSLLPWLATAAVVGQKLTGSDKGIW
ncbi:MAG TPA: nucleotidyltransferase family protein [Terracidiphilus sp.]|nr:nucleotidyltransferase family protein [Terracidiphilus sp.]